MSSDTGIQGFRETSFTYQGKTRRVYRAGTGPGVVVMHEIPGITPQVIKFARELVAAGFTVAMPDMFGEPGKALSTPYIAGQLARACISREFSVLAANKASPITEWLRALSRDLHNEIGGKGVGAIGMCLTGNFALALAMDECMRAPVLSQPSLPLPLTKAKRRALHIAPQQLECLKRRAQDENLKVLGLRFHGDPLSPPERFQTLRAELGEQFEAIEIESKFGNPEGNKPAHSVLTTDLIDQSGEPTREALDRVLAFFKETLV